MMHLVRLFGGLEVWLWLSKLGFLSATDLDLSLLGTEALGSDLDRRQEFVGFTDVVGADIATEAVALVVVEKQVISWVLTEGLGCVISLVLTEDLVDLG